ncbi:MAG TPA: ATP-binding protein, partial [Thermomicrobiales bacterium]|nr:ATP-binding protein [Thermomicrobiales bacterium]
MIYSFRTLLGYTQEGLSQAVQIEMSQQRNRKELGDYDSVSTNTITNWERKWLPTEKPRAPRFPTVRRVAMALRLKEGSPQYDALFEAWRVLQDDERPPSASRPDDSRQEFISAGRDRDLTRLDHAIALAVSGSPQFLLVRGETGVGKTRLINETCRRAVDTHRKLVTIWGDCVALSGSSDLYHPFVQAIDLMTGGLPGSLFPQMISVT